MSCTLLLFTAYAIVRTVPSANRPNRREKKTACKLQFTCLPRLNVCNDLAEAMKALDGKKLTARGAPHLQAASMLWKYPVFLAGERGKLLALCIFG